MTVQEGAQRSGENNSRVASRDYREKGMRTRIHIDTQVSV